MKKLLLAAFLLTAGMVTSVNVSAQLLPTIPNEWRQLSKVPPLVVTSANSFYAEITAALIADDAPYVLGTLTYYAYKGDYYATFPVYEVDTNILFGIVTLKYNRKGEEVN